MLLHFTPEATPGPGLAPAHGAVSSGAFLLSAGHLLAESLRLTLSRTNRGGQRAGHLRAWGPQGVNSWMTPRIVTGTGKKGSRQVSLHLRLWTQSHVFQLSPKSTDESITSASPVKQKEKGTHSLLLCPLSLRLCVGVCRCV